MNKNFNSLDKTQMNLWVPIKFKKNCIQYADNKGLKISSLIIIALEDYMAFKKYTRDEKNNINTIQL